MKIAIIGEGIAGLACAFYLKENAQITVFASDKGASYAAAGMMHKFVGDTGHKSVYADEAYEASAHILESFPSDCYKKTPILRKILTSNMKEGFFNYKGTDIEFMDEDNVKILDGYLIDVPKYLEKLKTFLAKHKVNFVKQFILPNSDFSEFDYVLICAGYGIKELMPDLKMKYLKGQAFIYDNVYEHKLPLIAKGYLAPFSDKVVIGSTYERQFTTAEPDLGKAHALLKDPISCHFKPYDEKTPRSVLAGVRVAHPNFNHPKVIKRDDKTFVITGLGSRGLLYHGFLGKLMKDYIVSKKTSSVFIL